MKKSMLKLADGDLSIDVEGAQRADEIGEMAQAVRVFHATSLERQKLNREARLLSQLNEWLQSCKSLDELYQMVGHSFQGCSRLRRQPLHLRKFARRIG